jgi:signal recognition particle subunit SRP72
MSSLPALSSLLKQAHIDDHDEILKAANSTLKQSKGDLEAQHVKVAALLKLDRFNEAIYTFETGGDRLKEKARLEYAYALYKTGKPAEAAEIARQGAERGYQHVEAQASYRMEDFARAAELYAQLDQRLEEDAEADIRINSFAADAQLEWAGRGELVNRQKASRREDMDSFEIMYNAGCDSIAQGLLGRADVLLKRARDLCSKLEDMTEEEKQAELLPITLQQVYVLARQGKNEEAGRLSSGVNADSITDASTKYIAQVNQIAANASPPNPFLAQRLIAKDIETLKPDYPFRYQESVMQQNRFATDLQALKFGGTAASTADTISKQPSPNLDPYYNLLSVVNAAAHARSQTGKEALKHIVPLLEKRPNDVGLILTIVQLYVLTGNSASAAALLERFLGRLEQAAGAAELKARFAPAVVGTLVSLYDATGRREQIRTELLKAATYWRRKSKDHHSAGVVHLLKATGSSLLDSQDPEHHNLANEIFTELHQQDENDRYAAAGLLAASLEASNASSLRPIDDLVASIDVDSLENAGIAQPPSSAAAVTTRKRPAEDTKPKKPKKIRKSRLPKDFDPNKQPDPERWLPLRDRSTYRPKGKKGKARQTMLAQGAAPTADSDGSRPGTPGGEVVKAKQPGGAAGKKKKGKSGKW